MATCGKCKAHEVDVQHVRFCYDVGGERTAYEDWEAKYWEEYEKKAEIFWTEGTEAQAAQYRWEVEQDELNAIFG